MTLLLKNIVSWKCSVLCLKLESVKLVALLDTERSDETNQVLFSSYFTWKILVCIEDVEIFRALMEEVSISKRNAIMILMSLKSMSLLKVLESFPVIVENV